MRDKSFSFPGETNFDPVLQAILAFQEKQILILFYKPASLPCHFANSLWGEMEMNQCMSC